MKENERADVGWIKLHRALRNWKYIRDGKCFSVWIHMLMDANFAPQEFQGETIERGELVFTFNTWEKKFKNFKPPITRQNLRTIIKNLEENNCIKKRHVTKKKLTIIKIVNYAQYQDVENQHSKSEKLTRTEQKSTQFASTTNTVNGKSSTVTNTVCKATQADETQLNKVFSEDQLEMFPVTSTVTNTVPDKINTVTGENQHSKSENQHSKSEKVTLLEEYSLKENLNNILNKHNKTIDQLCGVYKKLDLIGLVLEVLDYLNEKWYSIDTELKRPKFDPLNKDLVVNPFKNAFNRGFTDINVYKQIIDINYKKWLGVVNAKGIEMIVYLTPETLFYNKMDKYLHELQTTANTTQRIDNNTYYKHNSPEAKEDFKSKMSKTDQKILEEEEEARKIKEEEDRIQKEKHDAFCKMMDAHMKETESKLKIVES